MVHDWCVLYGSVGLSLCVLGRDFVCSKQEVATPLCIEQITCVLCSFARSANVKCFCTLGVGKNSFLDCKECKWGWAFAVTARFSLGRKVFAREELRFPPLAAELEPQLSLKLLSRPLI